MTENTAEGAAIPERMLYRFLLAQARPYYAARRAAVAALKTPDDVRRRQEALRAWFLEALGEFPERGPLNARVVDTLPGEGFHVERVIYESRPGHHVTANLYLPDVKPPYPGVLVPCGHSGNGKAEPAYQRACILLAQNGMAALCYDPIGQGERCQALDAKGKPLLSCTVEHTMAGVGALLVGSNVAAYRIWDGIRSLDYLAERPDIDPARLGCTGNSGGGTLTAYLMALDPRIAAAAPSCYLTTLERLFETIGPQDGEQNITGQVAFGLDHADYLLLRAPRPTLMCTAGHDFFDIDGAWTTFREAKRVYGILGHSERVDLAEFDDEHGFSKPRREAAMRWLRRWLLGRDDAPVERESPVYADAELQCTASGQVAREFPETTVFALNAQQARSLAAQRARHPARSSAEWQELVRKTLALPATIPPATCTTSESRTRDGVQVRHLRFVTEPGILVPALELTPEGNNGALPLLVAVNGAGQDADAGPGGPLEAQARAGCRVLALDLRGMGETAVKRTYDPNQCDFQEAYLSLHLNRPLLGQRVYDLLAVLARVLEEAPLPTAVRLVGSGAAGPAALHAALLEPRVQRLTLRDSLISWNAVACAPRNRDQLANAVPGVLAHYDLPELAAALAPRPLTIISPRDAMGEKPAAATWMAEYAACRDAYQRLGAAVSLKLNEDD